MPKPIYDSSKPNALFKARIEAALERLNELEVSVDELYAYNMAQTAIEFTQEQQRDDPETEMPETCEAYIEASADCSLESSDAWLSYLLNPPKLW